MKTVMGRAGRALYFAATNLKFEGFKIATTQDVPGQMSKIIGNVERNTGGNKCGIKTMDIVGCFPNMPQAAIKHAIHSLVTRAEKEGKEGVWVPYADTKKCAWVKRKKEAGTWLPWIVMEELNNFALDNSFVKMDDGRILKQVTGIPMGGPMSPGMTIATCAWMEEKWLRVSPRK